MKQTSTIQIATLMESSGVAFGTSGARGTVSAMSNPICYAYTLGFLQAMSAQQIIQAGEQVYYAGDLRSSTTRILNAVARAIEDAGYQASYVGRIPSPALAYCGIRNRSASIMVTGSHIPDDRNGIKFNRPDGEILKRDEALIRQQCVTLPEPFPDIAAHQTPALNPSAEQAYIERYLQFFPDQALQGLHIGVYEHSGVGRDILSKLLSKLGATTTSLARSEHFIPVDTEAIRDADINLGLQWAQQYAFDAIVSTDGDADRPLISDANGQWLRGDIVGVLCAKILGIQYIATPVSSNSAVEKSGWFKQVHRTRIGSPYVIEKMHQLLQSTNSVGGYEANGGFLLATEIKTSGRKLAPLPTRDAVLPILAILAEANQQQQSIRALVQTLPQRFTASNRLANFPTATAQAIITEYAQSNAKIEASFQDLCGTVAAIDTTDGLRITFTNNEIIHLRPSGNAPELRCYNEADTEPRAQELNAACLAILATLR